MSWWRSAQALEEMQGEPYSETCYHGSMFDPKSGVFEQIETGYSDYDAVWVTPDEDVAEWYAERYRTGGVPVVFEVPIDLQNVIRILDLGTRDEIIEACACSELTECIPALQAQGFDGWLAAGSTGEISYYEDVAVFYGELSPSRAKVKLNGQWTDWMQVGDVAEAIKSATPKARKR